MTDHKPLVSRRLYTHVIDVERFGTRKDGTKYERFSIMFPEDVRSAVSLIREKMCLCEGDLKYLGRKGPCINCQCINECFPAFAEEKESTDNEKVKRG